MSQRWYISVVVKINAHFERKCNPTTSWRKISATAQRAKIMYWVMYVDKLLGKSLSRYHGSVADDPTKDYRCCLKD